MMYPRGYHHTFTLALALVPIPVIRKISYLYSHWGICAQQLPARTAKRGICAQHLPYRSAKRGICAQHLPCPVSQTGNLCAAFTLLVSQPGTL